MTKTGNLLVAAAVGLRGACAVLVRTARSGLEIDACVVGMAIVFALLVLPTIPRATENPQQLAAFANDEPFLSMALEATTVFPYGNPANYFDGSRTAPPEHWGSLRYPGFHYYGGAYFQLAFPAFALFRLLGFEAFPLAPVVLRSVSAIASFVSLWLLYNFARVRSSRLAALLAITFLATDSYFRFYTTVIHPDVLQLLLALVALLVAARHAKVGDPASLLALGLMAGAVQGTKVGGPWLIPMSVLALWWGLTRDRPGLSIALAKRGIGRILILGSGSLLGYFVSTPYAFLGPYYFKALRNVWGIVSDSPLGGVSFLSWADGLRTHFGIGVSSLFAITVVSVLVSWFRSRNDPAAVLAVVLALSQLVWFGVTGDLWLMLGYMLVAFGLMAALSASFIAGLLDRTVGRIPRGRWLATAGTGILLLALLEQRWYPTASHLMDLYLYRHNSVFFLNAWAQAAIPLGSRVLHDDLAYLDPKVFPNSRMRGGVMSWADISSYRPEYVVLSSSIYAAPWYEELRRKRDPSMELYSQLVDFESPGPTDAKGIELVHVLRPSAGGDTGAPFSVCNWLRARPSLAWFGARCAVSGYQYRVIASRISRARGGPEAPLSGPVLKVYKVDLVFPVPISSSFLEPYLPSYAIDRARTAWNSAARGAEAVGEFVGVDLASARVIERVRVQWIYGQSTPTRLGVEFSDDGGTWKRATELAVDYAVGAPSFRIDEVGMGERDPHRFWRLIAIDVPPDRGFGVAELWFDERSSEEDPP